MSLEKKDFEKDISQGYNSLQLTFWPGVIPLSLD